MELDNKWVEEYEQEEEPYKDFYREKTKTIEIYYFYLNKDNELEKIKQQHYMLDEYNKLTREEVMQEIKSNIVDNKIKYLHTDTYYIQKPNLDSVIQYILFTH